MKALSIQQPWAYLIVHGFKDMENRRWRTAFRGRVYVHAGKKFDGEGLAWLTDNTPEVPNDFVGKAMAGDTSAYEVLMELDPDEYPVGAIVGEVDIVDCVTKSESPWFFGPYGFVLANPVQYEKPIPYKGSLGLFDVDGEVVRRFR